MLDLVCQGQIVTIYTNRVCAFVGTLIYSLIFMPLLKFHQCTSHKMILTCDPGLMVCYWLDHLIVISRGSEVIMFTPCVFVGGCVCVCHDVFFFRKIKVRRTRGTHNILLVQSWRCLVVQVMHHALMTSSMTSPGHKVGHILKCYIFSNIWARTSIKNSKYR